jgi:hypothetical protein
MESMFQYLWPNGRRFSLLFSATVFSVRRTGIGFERTKVDMRILDAWYGFILGIIWPQDRNGLDWIG